MTDTIPQDTSLPDDVVERVAKAAAADMEAQHEQDLDGPYLYDVHLPTRIGVDGQVDMHRLVRVISAALKGEA